MTERAAWVDPPALEERPAGGLRRVDFVLAIDFGGTKIAIGCATRDGELVVQRRLATLANRGATQAVERALAAGVELARDLADHGRGRLIGVGVVSPGVVLADRILLAPNVPGWECLSLPSLVSERVPGVPVATRNDARAAGLAELRWGNLRGIGTGLYVNVGTGVSAALVIEGRVVAGSHQAAGEIGYARPEQAAREGVVLLEDLVGGRHLARRASRAAGRPLSPASVFSSTDPSVRELVGQTIDELGRHLANFATLIDPERIVVGGGLMSHPDRILPRLRHWLDEVAPFPPEVMPAAFVADAALRGAVAIAIDAATEATADGPIHRLESPWRAG
jgi:glucokinase